MAKRIKAPSREAGRAQSDPILREIRSALRPDASVAWEPASAILPGLQRIRGKIDATLQQEPARALKLYEKKALRCYRQAGMMREWHSLEAEIRSRHRRKSGVLSGLDRISRLGACFPAT